jgi:hypothetical protein
LKDADEFSARSVALEPPEINEFFELPPATPPTKALTDDRKLSIVNHMPTRLAYFSFFQSLLQSEAAKLQPFGPNVLKR